MPNLPFLHDFLAMTDDGLRVISRKSNISWLPMFYALPKEIAVKRKEYYEMSRSPYDAYKTDKLDKLIKNNSRQD